MLKRCPSFMLAALVSCLMLAAPPAAQAQTPQAEAGRAKAEVTRLGEGARVRVTLRDRRKVTGHLSHVGESDFTLTGLKDDTTRTIAYADVSQVERRGGGMSGKAKFGIGAVLAVGLLSYVINVAK